MGMSTLLLMIIEEVEELQMPKILTIAPHVHCPAKMGRPIRKAPTATTMHVKLGGST